MSWPIDERRKKATKAAVVGLIALSGCALSDGDPFGIAELELGAQLEIPADRAAEAGRVKTSAGYLYQLEALHLGLTALTLTVGLSGDGAGFDPANPPDGYSLCHNGHCHADDGRLVSYADIELELGVDAPSRTRLTRSVSGAPSTITTTLTPARLGECPDRCALPRGEIQGLSLDLTRITLLARVFDEPERNPPRLPADGMRVQLDSYAAFTIDEALAVEVDADEPLYAHLRTVLYPSVRLFDGIDFEALVVAGSTAAVDLEEDPEVLDRLYSNFEENTELRVVITRTHTPSTGE